MSGAAAEDLHRAGGSGAVVRGGAPAGAGAGAAGKGIPGLRLPAAVAHTLLRAASEAHLRRAPPVDTSDRRLSLAAGTSAARSGQPAESRLQPGLAAPTTQRSHN